jgi:hypothetical protein
MSARGVLRAVALAAGLPVVIVSTAASPALAQDNQQPPPGYASCELLPGSGVNLPTGTVISNLPAQPPGVYLCINGMWIRIGGPHYFENPPAITPDVSSVTVDEGSVATVTGTFSYPGDEPVVLSSTAGSIVESGDGTWSWSHAPSDGPADSQTVTVTATAGERFASATFDLVVNNVAPSITGITPSTTVALTDQPVALTAGAVDPSPADTAAGFSWSFEGVASSSATHTLSFATCGQRSVSVAATDKDGAVSAPAIAVVDVLQASFGAPLTSGVRNLVRAGQVVPVRIGVGCDGVPTTGLAPSIRLLAGDVDPSTDTNDPAHTVQTPSVSAADSSNVMRPAGTGYLYNLRVPDAAVGTRYTVRVRPLEGSTSALYAVLEIAR